jgi:hypothetical protein
VASNLVSDEQLAGAIDAFDAAITRAGIPPGDLIDADHLALRAMRELQERRIEVEKYKAWAASCEPTPCSACFDAHSQIPSYIGIPDGDIADRVSDLVEQLEKVWQERDELRETLAHLTRGQSSGETGTAHASLAKRWTALADLYEREGIAPGVVELARESALALHPKTSCRGPSCGHPNPNEEGTCPTCREWREGNRQCDHKGLATVNADGFCLICGKEVL